MFTAMRDPDCTASRRACSGRRAGGPDPLTRALEIACAATAIRVAQPPLVADCDEGSRPRSFSCSPLLDLEHSHPMV